MLGLLLLGALAELSSECDEDECSYDENWYNEDMYACTAEWRSLHPYDYNPVTGGSSAEEDHRNGLYNSI